MYRALAQAILHTFRDRPAEAHRSALSPYTLRQWQDTYRWLDASGLALYFIARLQTLQIEDAIPTGVRDRLLTNLADNRNRTADSLAELVRLNRTLKDSGIELIHLKGISNVPDACPSPELRLQLDLDLLIRVADSTKCQRVLQSLGYDLISISSTVWEFKTTSTIMPSINDLYKTTPQRSVEVHFADACESKELFREKEWQEIDGNRLPTLPAVERLLAQATHLFKHLKGEWIRPSWLLEFRNSVQYRSDDLGFWLKLRTRAAEDAYLKLALGSAVRLTTLAFGEFAPRALSTWTAEVIDARMALWLDMYGFEVVLADFPGTKLYRLIPSPEPVTGQTVNRRLRLIPLRLPPMLVHVSNGSSLSYRTRATFSQLRYIAFRLNFHIRSGYQYLRERPRWRKSLAELSQPRPNETSSQEVGQVNASRV